MGDGIAELVEEALVLLVVLAARLVGLEGRSQLLEQGALVRGEVLGHHNTHRDNLIAAAAAPDVRDALPTQAEGAASLHAGRNLQRLGAGRGSVY